MIVNTLQCRLYSDIFAQVPDRNILFRAQTPLAPMAASLFPDAERHGYAQHWVAAKNVRFGAVIEIGKAFRTFVIRDSSEVTLPATPLLPTSRQRQRFLKRHV